MSLNRLGYIPTLDGIRAVAIILVLLTHANFQLGENGIMGVHVFFALSGFLITTLILEEKNNSGIYSFKNFYYRRFLRLIPALVFLLFGIFIYSLLFTEGQIQKSIWEEMVSALFYFNNLKWVWNMGGSSSLLSHTWSLSVEEQFYIFWPFLLIFIISVFNRGYFIICSIIGLFISIGLKELEVVGNYYYALVHESIFFGCLAAFFRIRFPDLKIGSVFAYIIFILIVLVGVMPNIFLSRYFIENFSGVTGLLTSFLILSLISNPNSNITFLLSHKVLVFTGKISYSLYLWHVPIFKWFKEYSPFEPWISFILKFVLSFIMALVSWYFVESRFFRIAKYKNRSYLNSNQLITNNA